MNKYFLSLISILLIFQSFKVFDELFFKEKELVKGYDVIKENENENQEIISTENNELEEEIDFEKIFAKVDTDHGKKISKQCIGCHDLSSNQKVKIGPPLWLIINRKSGSIVNFKYSKALKSYEKNWTREELFYFLENPKNYIKGTKMVYKGLKKVEDRVDIISYLEKLK